jgi:hypothetical protein
VRHESRLRVVGKDGKPARAHLEHAARRGHPAAVAALDGPPLPESLLYLYEWSVELDEARGYDMNGPRPVSYPDVQAWAQLTDRRPAPHEIRALLALDVVWRFPDAGEEK